MCSSPCGICTRTEHSDTQRENSVKETIIPRKRSPEEKVLELKHAKRLEQWVAGSQLEIDHCDSKHRKISRKRIRERTLQYPSDSRTFLPYVDQSTLKGYVLADYHAHLHEHDDEIR